jgi:hypothetical protein
MTSLLNKLSCLTLKNEGEVLSSSDKDKFDKFMSNLIPCHDKHIIYRGESLANLKRQFNVDNENSLAKFIFMVGEKSKSFLNQSILMPFEDTSKRNFGKILTELGKVLLNSSKGSKGRVKRMTRFIDQNGSFYNAVTNCEQRDRLLITYEHLTNKAREIINLFYLVLLHTINSSSYKTNSKSLSTSISLNVANQFSKDILLVGWYPTAGTFEHNGGIVINDNIGDNYKGIPLCKPVYKSQREISLRYGFLPHFIIGFLFKNKREFYVNPTIFSLKYPLKKGYLKKIVGEGLPVDQSYFDDLCRHTAYRYYFTRCNGHYELSEIKNSIQ